MAQQRKRLKKLNTLYNKEKENNLTYGTAKKREKYKFYFTRSKGV